MGGRGKKEVQFMKEINNQKDWNNFRQVQVNYYYILGSIASINFTHVCSETNLQKNRVINSFPINAK